MAKDAVATMGAVLPDDAGGRDAVHVAVISVVASMMMKPGTHVALDGLAPNGEYLVSPITNEPIGILDPFISETIQRGQRVWLYLYPRTITGLSHLWSHPAIPDVVAGTVSGGLYHTPAQKLASEQWLRNFCSNHDAPDYGLLVEAATSGEFASNGEDDYYGCSIRDGMITSHGHDAHGEIPDEFWNHLEVVSGRKFEKREQYFNCSC